MGFSTKPELVPLDEGGQQRPGSPAHMAGAALSAKGSSLNKWRARSAKTTYPKFEGGKVVSVVVMPPQAHRELQGKQNKTKQTSRSGSNSCWTIHVWLTPYIPKNQTTQSLGSICPCPIPCLPNCRDVGSVHVCPTVVWFNILRQS